MEAFEFMSLIKDKTFKLSVADIPYNIGIAEWDSIEKYEEWVTKLFAELKRISEQQIIFFACNYTKIFEELETPYMRFIWHREGGRRGKSIKYSYEPFYWYGDTITYNRITEPNPYAEKDKRLQLERTIGNVWRIPNLVGRKREALGHPTQKPIKLIDRIIRMASNEGDLILDAFSGTGTTSVAAVENNRQVIGFDNGFSKKHGMYWADVANKRIENIQEYQI